jgi:hypothetical protein
MRKLISLSMTSIPIRMLFIPALSIRTGMEFLRRKNLLVVAFGGNSSHDETV